VVAGLVVICRNEVSALPVTFGRYPASARSTSSLVARRVARAASRRLN
jgi:hypothetical protein